MSKVIREEFVCDEHAETHEAPFEFEIKIRNRETGEQLGVYGIDACEDVVNWYKAHAEVLVPVAPKRKPRKRTSTRAKRTQKKNVVRRRTQKNTNSNQEIRSWAKEQKLSVNDRGKIPQSVVDAYALAHA